MTVEPIHWEIRSDLSGALLALGKQYTQFHSQHHVEVDLVASLALLESYYQMAILKRPSLANRILVVPLKPHAGGF